MLHRHLLMRPDTDFPVQRDNPQKELPSFQAFSHIILQNPDKHFESFQYIHHHEAVKQLLGSPSIISRPYLSVQNPPHCLLSDATIIPLKNSTSQSAPVKILLADAMPVPYLPLSFVMFRPESTDRFHEEKSQARLHSLTLPPLNWLTFAFCVSYASPVPVEASVPLPACPQSFLFFWYLSPNLFCSFTSPVHLLFYDKL